MNIPKSAMTVICDDLNAYINEKGKIQKSTFIKIWHDLENQDWKDVFNAAMRIHESTGYKLSKDLLTEIRELEDHMKQYGYLHKNILDPHFGAKLDYPATQIGHDSVKTVLWRTMMRLREYYCWVIGIDLPNEDSSIGKLNAQAKLNPFEQMFEKSD